MIECTNFKTHQKGSLQGFADLFVDSWGVEIKGCSLFMKGGRRWVTFPSREYDNKEGEKKYMPYIRFRNKEHMDAFATQAKEAIDKWCMLNPENKPEVPESSVSAKEVPF